MSTDARTKENLLHFFIRNRFKGALTYFLQSVLTQENFKLLCFQPNLAQKIPLMTALGKGMESSAMELWELMENLEPVRSDEEVEKLEERRKNEEEEGGSGEQRKVEWEGSKKEEKENKEEEKKEEKNNMYENKDKKENREDDGVDKKQKPMIDEVRQERMNPQKKLIKLRR